MLRSARRCYILSRRYKRKLLPGGGEEETREYKTLVHALPVEELAHALRAKVSEPWCREGPCGLDEDQAAAALDAFGPNAIAPPKRESKSVKLACVVP